MYCNKQFASGDCLTKEHIVPKSKGGSYQIKGACHECNMTRGDDMDFPPFVTLVKRCPAILFMADRRVSVWECNAGGSTLASASQKKMFVEDFLTQQHVNNEQMLRSRLASESHVVQRKRLMFLFLLCT